MSQRVSEFRERDRVKEAVDGKPRRGEAARRGTMRYKNRVKRRYAQMIQGGCKCGYFWIDRRRSGQSEKGSTGPSGCDECIKEERLPKTAGSCIPG